MFVNLLTRSYYSFFRSNSSIDDIIQAALEHHCPYACLIDINVLHGAVEFFLKAKQFNLKPILGLSLFVQNEELIVVAKNYTGYLQLCKISSAVNKKLDFWKYFDKNCIVIASDRLIDKINIENIFSFSQIAIHEVDFIKKEQTYLSRVLQCIKNNEKLNDHNFTLTDNYFWTQEEARRNFTSSQLQQLDNILKEIDLDLELEKHNFFVECEKNPNALLKQKCELSLVDKFRNQIIPNDYFQRLKKELSVIEELNFANYFLVVSDYVTYAKQNNILVGPGRGSAVGCLVSYLLDITEIDPLKYNLFFERFLNLERKTMPDIDVDFMDSRRSEVVDYITKKYGQDRVAHIVTFQKNKIKTALRDAGRILNIDLSIINSLSKLITFKQTDFSWDAVLKQNKQFQKEISSYPLLAKITRELVGIVRQSGLHAAGIVISSRDLDSIVPTCLSNDGKNVVQYSMEYIEKCGLIKMDLLGLNNLSIINDANNLLQRFGSKRVDWKTIDLNDQEVYASFSCAKTTGIFQFESPGMRNLLSKIRPKSIQELALVAALFRPGPLNNTDQYLFNREHQTQINYYDEKLRPILRETYGIIVYQEQIIQIARSAANYSLAKADVFRRIISKKKVNEIGKTKDDFIQSCVKNNFTVVNANKIFENIAKFAEYGFNYSHALAYVYISYLMMYLKVHFRSFFYAALIQNSASSQEVQKIVDNCKKHNISCIMPEINFNYDQPLVTKNSIILNWSDLKIFTRIELQQIEKILQQRGDKKFADYREFLTACFSNNVSIKTVETLAKNNCLSTLFNNDISVTDFLDQLPQLFAMSKNFSTKFGYIGRPEMIKNISKKNTPLFQDPKELSNVSKIRSQLKQWKEKWNKTHPTKIIDLVEIETYQNDSYQEIYVVGEIKALKQAYTKEKEKMLWITVQDDTTEINKFTIFSNQLKEETSLNQIKKGYKYLLVITKRNACYKICRVITKIDLGAENE